MLRKISLLLITISLFTFIGCKNEDDKKCEHASSSWIIEQDASCTEDGNKALKCDDCNEILETEIIKSVGHTYEEVPNSAVDATYETEGKEADIKCSKCGDTIYGKVIPMLVHEHTFDSSYTYDEQMHWKESTCGHDVQDEKEEHTLTDGKCLICGYIKEIVLEPSDYLEFSLCKSNTAYSVTGLKNDVTIKDIVIPTTYNDLPVVRIDTNAFKNAQIDTVVIPEGITEIYDNAFRDSSIKEISLPSSITKVYDFVFTGCSKLTKLSIDASLTSSILVGNNETFGVLDSLLEASVPADLVQKLNTKGGYSASKLEKLTVNGGKIIKGPSNKFTSLKTLIILEGVEEISSGAFGSTLIKDITLPASLTTIGSMAFSGVETLETVSFAPNSKLTTIGTRAFNTSGLSTITLPNSLQTIGENAFTSTNLVDITIPGSVKVISEYCFAKCLSLTNVTVQNGVQEIQLRAFSECNALTTVVLPGTLTTMGESVFELCRSLVSINIPLLLTYIPKYTFDRCTNLTSITIPSNVKSLNAYAFKSCIALTDVSLCEGLEIIDNHAFFGCPEITSIALPKGLMIINESAFSSKKLLSVLIPESVTLIGDGAFASDALLFYEGKQEPTLGKYYCPILLYSEVNLYSSRYWHYVDGVPTRWDAY